MTQPLPIAKKAQLKLTIGVSEASQTRTVRRLEYEGAELRDLLDDALEGVRSRERVAWIHIDRPGPAHELDVADELGREPTQVDARVAPVNHEAAIVSLDERRSRRSQVR